MIVLNMKTIIFDVMGVIFTEGDDVENLLVPFIKKFKPHISKELIKRHYLKASLGELKAEGFWQELGFTPKEAEELEFRYLEKSFTLDPDFMVCARELSTHYQLAVLSNDILKWHLHLRKKYGLDTYIEKDKFFISSALGLRKPDPEIYRQVLAKLQILPQECFFVDDYPERVLAGEALGIKGILFNRLKHNYSGKAVESFAELAACFT